ncbi:RNA polymerase sigma factor SigV [Botrimarina colliarenosi]|uniref:RNA polymerase sigma factor SigV n=1 Tax=Botrimarina colliarenosi TaxID=2528001 RepID=A0A5C6AEY5_9BACT|nr:sigma-70 family RNA polymerase sigma factor [Botrimarina colliarenosi]TWT97990.1 RNA polymerase sigma factor SigV [Botrimarina colliarenosi]
MAELPFHLRVRALTDQLGMAGIDVLGGLFDLTAQRLVRLAVAITRNQYDGEDAVQAVMTRIAVRPDPLRDAQTPWAYLLRMVRNEALLVARKKRRWITTTHSITDLVTSRRVDELELEDTHRAVWAALRSLPAAQAEVVVLKTWEQMTFAEIAEVLDESPNTVASRYQYGLQKLATRLQKTADEALGHRAEVQGGRR